MEIGSVKLQVDLRPGGAGDDSGEIGEAAAVFRVHGPLDIELIHPEYADGVEFIKVYARSDVDLRGGLIGDGDEVLVLPHSEHLRLRSGHEISIYTYCGPPVPTAVLLPQDRLKTWEITCNKVVEELKNNDRTLAIQAKEPEAKAVVTRVLRNFEKQYFLESFPNDAGWKGCKLLYAEMLFRKLYWRATGKDLKDVNPYPSHRKITSFGSITEDLKSPKPEASYFVDRDTGDRQVRMWLGHLSGDKERRCLEPIENGKAVLARCIDTSPVKGEQDHPFRVGEEDEYKNQRAVECIRGLPRFRGMYKNEPGEGDRVVIMDSRKRVVLDVDYWWPEDEKR